MYINAIITTNAKKPHVTCVDENNYKIKVDAAAIDGKANIRLIALLSEYFKVNKSHISIIKGSRSRKKYIYIKIE